MSGRRIADLLIKIGADSYEFQQKTKQVEQGLDGLSKRLDSMGKELSLKLTAPLAALGAVALKNYDEQIQRDAKLLRALDGRADVQQRLIKQAAELQAKSTLGDEAFIAQQSYFATLKLNERQIKNATEAATELSYAFKDQGMNIETAAKYIGQMYGGSVGRLGRLIPELKEFTAEQLKSGEGIKYILENYRGYAEVAAKEGLGFMHQIKNQWGDLMEDVGKAMLPAVQRIGESVKKIIAWFQALSPETKKVIVVVAAIAAAAGPVLLALGSLLKMLPLLKAGFSLLIAPITVVRTAIMGLTTAISTNPIGLLLTALAAGITLFMAFRKGTDDATKAAGEHTNKVMDEATQVNTLIGKLSSANTSEKERKAALDELAKIQPGIVEGLSAESVELGTLKKRAAEYNQQLVLRIALARKQDQVAAAIERQTEAGVKQAEKEAELYGYLANIGSKIAAGDFEYGKHSQTKGFYEWGKASESAMRYVQDSYSRIMASSMTLDEKARKISLMFSPSTNYGDKIRMDDVSVRRLGKLRGGIHELSGEVDEAAELVAQAEAEVKNFADAFSSSLASAIGVATDAADGLGGAADGASKRTQRSIAELNEEIKDLEDQKKDSFDPAEITAFNKKIAGLKEEVDRLNKLGTGGAQKVTGRIAEINAEMRKLEEAKQKAYDVREIATYNDKIAELKKELESLNSVTIDFLDRKPLEPILTGDLAKFELITPEIKIQMPDLMPYVSKVGEQMKAIHDKVKEGMFSWAGEISEGLAMEILETEAIVKTYTDALIEKGWNFTAALDFVYSKVEETTKAFDDSLANFLSNSIVAAAEAIGQIMTGDLGFGGLMKAILLQFAGFLKQIGTQMIQFGIMIVAFKTVLKSVLANPWAAIAVGAAMVAAAAIMTALINKSAKDNAPKLAQGGLAFGPTYAMVGDNPNSRVDPEVIAPLSRLKEMMTAGGGTANVNITMSGELRAKGRDLVYALGKENFKTDVLGG